MNDDDKTAFEQAMRDVRPINDPGRYQHPPKRPAVRKKHRLPPEEPTGTPPILSDHSSDHDRPDHAHSGVNTRQYKRLKQGHIPIDTRLDLHGKTVDQARHAVSRCIEQARQQQQRCLHIIHGKGHGSAGGMPILKQRLLAWLNQHPAALAWTPAPPHLGGHGATLVLLRKSHHQPPDSDNDA